MSKRAGIVFLSLGAVLILSALLLLLYNQHEDAKAGQEAENLLAKVQSAITEHVEETRPSVPVETTEPLGTDPVVTVRPEPTEEQEATEATEDPELMVVEIDGYGYIGYLEIPALELELPVMSDWDYTRLKIAPCRQFGSSKSDDLVIAAHNYSRHFGQLITLQGGETVFFTDMEGELNRYAVSRIEKLEPNEVAAVINSGSDLVLYTCTYGGENRVVVFCDRIEDEAEHIADKLTAADVTENEIP